MNPYERIAVSVAEALGRVNPVTLSGAKAFCFAVDRALASMDEQQLIDLVVDLGSLTQARNPYGVIIDRVRRAIDHVDRGNRLADELAETRRWGALETAAQRGQTLRDLVARGALFEDEAVARIADDFVDPSVRDTALDALRGGQR